ncbi:MAG: Maf family protein [Bacillota bacterium]
MVQIVLASASPRRSELLKQIGLNFKVVTSNIDENNRMNLSAVELVQHLAYEKAFDVAKRMNKNFNDAKCLVIGADTVVVKDGILGKPKDSEDAFKMLKQLQGGWHKVITGIAVIDALDLNGAKSYEVTDVKMKTLSDDAIYSYIDSKEPMDKAGAYGIQGLGAVLVEKIDGCYFNVVGLPIAKLSDLLRDFGVFVL